MSTCQKSITNEVVDLNVGGVSYATTRATLAKHPNSLLYEWFAAESPSLPPMDARGYYFVDRDGQLFRHILNYLRDDNLILPSYFPERNRLLCEAKYFKLNKLVEELSRPSTGISLRSLSMNSSSSEDGKSGVGFITIGYQGTFSFGPQGLAADVNFRKINRILVSGRVSICREVFGDTLNEGRDPDRGHQNDRDRYTARYYLKHNLLEYAFDMLAQAGFKLISSCASGTSGTNNEPKPSSNTEEDRWAHYNEFLFYRGP